MARIFRAGGWFNGLAARIHYRGSTLSNQRSNRPAQNAVVSDTTGPSHLSLSPRVHPAGHQQHPRFPRGRKRTKPLVNTLPHQQHHGFSSLSNDQPKNANGDQPPFGNSSFMIFIGPLPCRTVIRRWLVTQAFGYQALEGLERDIIPNSLNPNPGLW